VAYFFGATLYIAHWKCRSQPEFKQPTISSCYRRRPIYIWTCD